MADLYIKLPHDLFAYDVLLVLGLDLVPDGRTATGTTLGQRGFIPLIHEYWNRTAVVLAMCRPRLPAVTAWIRLPLAPGKRGGLPLQTPASFFQFLLEPLDLALQPLVLLAQSLHLLQSPIQFPLGHKFQGLRIGLRCGFRPPALVRPSHPQRVCHGSARMSSPLRC